MAGSKYRVKARFLHQGALLLLTNPQVTFSVRLAGYDPSQSVTFTLTGMVLPYLKMLFGGPGLMGWRIPVIHWWRQVTDARTRNGVQGVLGKYKKKNRLAAKVELEKRLAKKGLGERIVGIETVDKMTDRQIAAKVRQHFQK